MLQLEELYNQERFVLIAYLPVKTLRFRIKGKEIILRGYFNEQKNPYCLISHFLH